MYVCLTWGLNSGLTSNKPTHFLIEYGDFIIYDCGFIFGQKLTYKHRCLSCWCAIMVQNPWLAFSTILKVSDEMFAQLLQAFTATFHMTLWEEFVMCQAITFEKSSKQNLRIWSNLICFYRSWLLWTLPLILLNDLVAMIRRQLWSFWANLDCRWARQHVLSDVVFIQNLAILQQFSLPHFSCLKHP